MWICRIRQVSPKNLHLTRAEAVSLLSPSIYLYTVGSSDDTDWVSNLPVISETVSTGGERLS